VNGEILSSLESLKLPVISHIHELNYWINKSGELNLKYVKNFSSRYIVASEAVRRCLVVDYGFDNDIIESVSEFVLFENLQKRADKLSLKQKLNIPTNAIIVGASGAEDWRKGKDWFIPMAIDVLAITKNMNIHFVWIGGRLNDELEFDLDKSGIKDKVHFIEHLPEANRYFSEFSVFAMLSREDPFPVVNLEAAGLGVPIICFDNSGGTPELIANGCGFSVPYANLHDFAEKVVRLIEDNKLYFQMSEAGILAVKTKYDIDIIANKLVDIIYSVVDK